MLCVSCKLSPQHVNAVCSSCPVAQSELQSIHHQRALHAASKLHHASHDAALLFAYWLHSIALALLYASYIAALLLSGGGVPAAAADDDDSDDDDSTVRSRVDGSPSLKRNELQTYESNASSNAGPLAGGLTIPSAATKSNDDPGITPCAAEGCIVLCIAGDQVYKQQLMSTRLQAANGSS